MTQNEVRQGYINHAARAQLHRWFQIYENEQASVGNHLDILDPSITVKTAAGELVGLDACRQQIAGLPRTERNSHFVRESQIAVATDGAIDLQATCLNQVMAPGASAVSTDVIFKATLKQTDTVLPRFTRIQIEAGGEGTAPGFTDTYPRNRSLSLLHYYLALVEDPKRNLDPFAEVLASEFVLQFPSGNITDFTAFGKWFHGTASSVSASTHEVVDFSCRTIDANNFQLQADLAWQGIFPNNSEMLLKTRHSWTVVDNPKERFARIRTVAVETLEPLRPKP